MCEDLTYKKLLEDSMKLNDRMLHKLEQTNRFIPIGMFFSALVVSTISLIGLYFKFLEWTFYALYTIALLFVTLMFMWFYIKNKRGQK